MIRFVEQIWCAFPGPPFTTHRAELAAMLFSDWTRPAGWWWTRAAMQSLHCVPSPSPACAGGRTPIGAGEVLTYSPASGGGAVQ